MPTSSDPLAPSTVTVFRGYRVRVVATAPSGPMYWITGNRTVTRCLSATATVVLLDTLDRSAFRDELSDAIAAGDAWDRHHPDGRV